MKEIVSNEKHISIEMMASLANTPYVEELSTRKNKENILNRLEFSKGTNVSKVESFDFSKQEDEDARFRSYIEKQIDEGKYLSLLIFREKWQNVGGCPVAYIFSPGDISKKIITDGGKVSKILTQSGELVTITNESKVTTYTRKRSIAKEISGFDNYSEQLNVRLGGGFRLQLDNVLLSDNQVSLILSSYFSFNDFGSRVLALTSDEDQEIPRYSGVYQISLADGQLTNQSNKIEPNKTDSASDICQLVLNNLIEKDGGSVVELLKIMMSVKPDLRIHQLEGIWGINDGISTEIIDFDGVDSIESAKSVLGIKENTSLTQRELILRKQLIERKFLISDPIPLRDFFEQKKEIANSLLEIINSGLVSDHIVNELKTYYFNIDTIFQKKCDIQMQLGKLFKTINLPTNQTSLEHLKIFKENGFSVTLIEVGGLSVAFMEDEGEMIKVTDIKKDLPILLRKIGVKTIPAYFNYIIEGD